MPLKSPPLEEPNMNLTSMIDVMLVLIIFFLYSTKFAEEERQYDVQLPTVADAAPLTGQPDEIVVNVTATGEVTVRGEPRSMTELEHLLQEAREQFPGQSVVIRGDGGGKYQPIMDVMAASRRAGIRNLSLAHRPGGAAP